jgi:hypothetical protein
MLLSECSPGSKEDVCTLVRELCGQEALSVESRCAAVHS